MSFTAKVWSTEKLPCSSPGLNLFTHTGVALIQVLMCCTQVQLSHKLRCWASGNFCVPHITLLQYSPQD